MAIYTRLDQQQIHEITRQFNIVAVNSKAMGFGSANSIYIIESNDKNKYILSVAEEQGRDHVESTARALNWISEHKIHSAKSLKTLDDEWSLLYNDKPHTMRTFIEGKVELSPSEGMLGEVGEELAALHRVPVPDFLPKDHIYNEKKFTDVIGKGKDQDFEDWLKLRLEFLNGRIREDLPKGFIHGDLFSDNMIFDRRRFEAFIDFEMACDYYLAYDLGMAITGLCRRGLTIDLDKAAALIQAYTFFRELEDSEWQLLQTFTELAAVHTSNWRYWKFHFDAPNPGKSKKHLEMYELAEHIRRIPKENFLQEIMEDED